MKWRAFLWIVSFTSSLVFVSLSLPPELVPVFVSDVSPVPNCLAASQCFRVSRSLFTTSSGLVRRSSVGKPVEFEINKSNIKGPFCRTKIVCRFMKHACRSGTCNLVLKRFRKPTHLYCETTSGRLCEIGFQKIAEAFLQILRNVAAVFFYTDELSKPDSLQMSEDEMKRRITVWTEILTPSWNEL